MKSIILWSIILAVFITVFFAMLGRTERLIPGVLVFENQAGLGINIADFIEAEENNRILFSARITDHGSISFKTPIRSLPVEMIYANLASELHMTAGVFPRTYNTIAISEDLAVKWFLSTDILGVEVFIDNRPFNICGVYRDEMPIFSGLNNHETVYLHLSAFPYNDMQITQLRIRPGIMLPAQALDAASQVLDKKLLTTKVTDYHSLLRLAQQSKLVIWFLLGLCAVVMLFIIFCKQSAALVKCLRGTAENYKNVIDWKRLIWQSLLCIVLVGLAVVITIRVLFEPYFSAGFDLRSGGMTGDVTLLYVIIILSLLPAIMLVKAIFKFHRQQA